MWTLTGFADEISHDLSEQPALLHAHAALTGIFAEQEIAWR